MVVILILIVIFVVTLTCSDWRGMFVHYLSDILVSHIQDLVYFYPPNRSGRRAEVVIVKLRVGLLIQRFNLRLMLKAMIRID